MQWCLDIFCALYSNNLLEVKKLLFCLSYGVQKERTGMFSFPLRLQE